MSIEFKYFTDKEFGRQPNGYDPCYRTIICHALFKHHKARSNVKNIFNKLHNAYEDQLMFREENLFELYPISMDENNDSCVGYLFVDKTRGCYPLVLYPDAKEYTGNISASERTVAFQRVLYDLKCNIEGIIGEFDKHEEWNNELQNNLQCNHFHYR